LAISSDQNQFAPGGKTTKWPANWEKKNPKKKGPESREFSTKSGLPAEKGGKTRGDESCCDKKNNGKVERGLGALTKGAGKLGGRQQKGSLGEPVPVGEKKSQKGLSKSKAGHTGRGDIRRLRTSGPGNKVTKAKGWK